MIFKFIFILFQTADFRSSEIVADALFERLTGMMGILIPFTVLIFAGAFAWRTFFGTPDESRIASRAENGSTIVKTQTPAPKFKKCLYCGGNFSSNISKCSNCGASA